ncbi:hypothetical protein DBV05_g10664 [Lasiodiplodia theobromae]|uniref:Duf1665 domain containing protein n=1 Tax=Lasiodiplodia theobromae TaxID=45133 RepID=A0A5N5CZA4_9PEZI|nr:hypothetical protein DBV05_g10664 [Lasiodiplodia theobromae]
MASMSENETSLFPGQDTFLPGFGLPIDTWPPWSRKKNKERFPHAISEFGTAKAITLRERRMLDFINKISDKPEWDRKVFDEAIVSEWRVEAMRFDDKIEDVYLSEQMFDYCILELREKAMVHREKGLVAVLDTEATVVKSDVAVPETLRQALLEHVKPLEDVPEHLKDWHPGSNEMVLDLVHPSLFPIVFGRTRALPSGRVPLDDCVKYTGKGEVIPEHDADDYDIDDWIEDSIGLPAWGNYQWLPAQIDFMADGQPKIASYINNLHPRDHAGLYHVLEQLVDKAIPLWNECLSWFHDRTRINPTTLDNSNWDAPPFPARATHPDSQLDDSTAPWTPAQDRAWASSHDLASAYDSWWQANRTLKPLEPRAFKPSTSKHHRSGASPINLRTDFARSGLQVIFKLATIHLSPTNPVYPGGAWHIEGSLAERICATALYYPSSRNTTPATTLSFRTTLDVERAVMTPPQGEWESMAAYCGIANEETAGVQRLGGVTTPEGRMVAFPNTLQHRVGPVRLVDGGREGSRMVVAMFLVDPRQRVLSSAEVPPQRRDWWEREVGREVGEGDEEVVVEGTWGWDEAVRVREELMAERGRMGEDLDEIVHERVFSFCEH